MKQETWWDYFEEDPFEKIGRQIVGSFGETITIQLPRINWAYMDWLEENAGGKVEKFFVDNEIVRRPEHGCIHEWMEGAVRKTFLSREKKGLPRPPWCTPATPAEFMDI